jgi:hypothetical protein
MKVHENFKQRSHFFDSSRLSLKMYVESREARMSDLPQKLTSFESDPSFWGVIGLPCVT